MKILLIDDDEDDYIITRDLLGEIEGTPYELEWVMTYEAGLAAIGRGQHDVYLVDYRLGKDNGLQLLREAIASGCQTPIIMLTGQGHHEVDVEAMQIGASDYQVKGRIDALLLERSIRYSIERKQTEQRLAQLAQYDALTGLANRALFQDRLPRALNRAERSNKLVALMFLDLDLFKTINDTFGHDAGDELLKSVAERLRGGLRKVDTIARLGGDEFTVILEGIEQIQDVAAIAQKILDVMAAPFLLEGQEVFVTTSIGVTIYPTDGKTADHLMRNADTAMYRAKENGRNNYQFYTEDMKVRLLRQLSLESCLRRAVEREEFVLYYQPQVDLHTGEIICVEALIRWQRRDEGGRLIAPGEFLPLAEETGLIVPIGEWVLRKACTQSKAWQKAGLSPLRVAVNLSAHQFKQRYLVERLSGILKDAELEPRYLGLELTEALLADAAHAQKAMEKLKDLGATIAIDDFGAGYFSLNYLKRLPIDALKIDRSFVSDVTSNPDDAAVAAAIIALAHALRIEVIAEGVETEAQVGFLRKHGCRGIQGYLLSRPMPAEEVAVWMKGMMQKQERFNVNANKEEKQNSGAIFKSEPLRATCEDFGSFW